MRRKVPLVAFLIVSSGLLFSGDSDAYEFPVHFTVTLWLAETAGFPEADSALIARFDQATDDDPTTGPSIYSVDSASVKRRADYHFTTPRRLSDLQRLAEGCQRGRPSEADFKRIGQYLHALEDRYSHRGHDNPVIGHAMAGHSPDWPWTNPDEFVAMVQAKFLALVDLLNRCAPARPRTTEADFVSRVKPMLEGWERGEYAIGKGAPGGSARFLALLQTLFGSRFQAYEAQRRQYEDRAERMRRTGWRTP